MQALWGEPTSAVSEARRCLSRCLLRLSLASLLCSESMLRRCAKSTFETFELQRPMYVRCKPHVPLLNLNRTHAPSEGDGRTIHDNIYKYIYIYTDSAGVDRTRRGSLRLAPNIYIYIYTDSAGVDRTRRGSLRLAPIIYALLNVLYGEQSACTVYSNNIVMYT